MVDLAFVDRMLKAVVSTWAPCSSAQPEPHYMAQCPQRSASPLEGPKLFCLKIFYIGFLFLIFVTAVTVTAVTKMLCYEVL